MDVRQPVHDFSKQQWHLSHAAICGVVTHRITNLCVTTALPSLSKSTAVQNYKLPLLLFVHGCLLAFFEELATRERFVEEAHCSLAVHAMSQFSLY